MFSAGMPDLWRNDGKCGWENPLPDNRSAHCDPDGENPCCRSWDGECLMLSDPDLCRRMGTPCCDDDRSGYGLCGNTAEYCSCRVGCTNYTRIYREWEESGGTLKWRYDGRCGLNYPLPDGSPAQCDLDGDKPCCSMKSTCSNRDREQFCVCDSCVDYWVVREIKKSGEKCAAAMMHNGILKHACFDEVRHQVYYKCINSDVYYKPNFYRRRLGLDSFSAACENDPKFYQACGFTTVITNTDVLCSGYISEEGGKNKFIFKKTANSLIYADQKYRALPCANNWGDDQVVPQWIVCVEYRDCNGGLDEQNCHEFPFKAFTCIDYRMAKLYNKTVQIFQNGLSCPHFDVNGHYPYPDCLNYRDQTNCTRISRSVGGYCKVNGYWSSVSKLMVCHDYDKHFRQYIQLCDDGIQNICIFPSTSDCRVHKHMMCNGEMDCSDGSDETHQMCRFTSEQSIYNFSCKRRFQPRSAKTRLPVSWLMDGVADCMYGEDENLELWVVCPGNVILPAEFPCKNVFFCPGSNSSVLFRYLCNGIDSCGNGAENKVCWIAREFPFIDTIGSMSSSDLTRNVCVSDDCERREFIRPWGKVFGETEIELLVPKGKVNCDKLFGEHYVYLSCMDLCMEAVVSCPLNGENRKLLYDSCPGQYPGRAYTLGNNSFLTFVVKSENGHYHQNFFLCNNNRCIEYNEVCNLVDDCGDMSDEINCDNNMICEDTKNSETHQIIPLSQKCDGIYDCFDLSDECNVNCGRQILGNWLLKCICWLMGISAVLFNFCSIVHGSTSLLKDCQTASMMKSKMLLILIALGDFLMGLYLIILSVYDSLIFQQAFCKGQTEWLTGTPCMVLGVISTVGSQVSLFSMTVFSFIRMYGLIYRSMRIPGPVNKKSLTKVILLASVILIGSLAIALIPLVPSLEDYFVQGMYYDPSYQVFIGFPTKSRHIDILNAYYNYSNITSSYMNQISANMPWKDIGERVDNMFSQNYGYLDRKPVHFYGNDGVCLFKYFVRTDDARRSRRSPGSGVEMNDPVVWTMLIVNLICFMIMTYCYIRIIRNTRQSTQTSGQCDNLQRSRENRAMERRIMVIIGTDFMCWVPFIFISGLHNLRVINASNWYTSFAMTVLPLNSVINPLIYDKAIGEFIIRNITRLAAFIRSKMSSAVVAITGLFRTRNINNTEPENIPMEIINPPRDNENY